MGVLEPMRPVRQININIYMLFKMYVIVKEDVQIEVKPFGND